MSKYILEGDGFEEDDGIKSDDDRHILELKNIHSHHLSQHLIDEGNALDPYSVNDSKGIKHNGPKSGRI